MREKKFRGKRSDNGEWVFGWYVHDEEWAKEYIYRQEKIGVFFQLVCHKVDPETVGQYTGLKDKTGKEIYEGDIVEEGESRVVIEWHDDGAKFWYKIPTGYAGLYGFYGEIIGNRHDDPELLKGESQGG